MSINQITVNLKLNSFVTFFFELYQSNKTTNHKKWGFLCIIIIYYHNINETNAEAEVCFTLHHSLHGLILLLHLLLFNSRSAEFLPEAPPRQGER